MLKKEVENFSFNVTEKAKKRISKLIERESHESLMLRIEVASGGCSGLLRYKYKLTNVVTSCDIILLKGKIALDATSSTFLKGATLDYVEGFGRACFQITNPNATSRCGCGHSFSV